MYLNDEVLLAIANAFDRLGLRYAVGGSTASGIHGKARSTRDLDVLVELTRDSAARLSGALGPDFYVPEATMRQAVEQHASFNVIHKRLAFKVDLYVAGNSALDTEELERVVRIAPVEGSPQIVSIASPEVIVLRKLDWFRRSGSERQWTDVIGVLELLEGRLDLAWMRRQAAALGVSDLLERALGLKGPPPR